MTSASKVGDLFATAGEAFSQLAGLAHLVQANKSSNNGENDCGWSAEDTESLQLAVKKFGDDLNIISEHIKDKAMHQIKSAYRKVQPSLSNTVGKTSEELVSTSASSQSTVSQPMHSNNDIYSHRNEPSSSSIVLSPPDERMTSVASSAQVSATATSSLTLPSAGSTASICSSPSPFLHYPLIRRGADITLNMLNAGDDSDDDDRMTRSVFNSA